jgi:hypothetical protein
MLEGPAEGLEEQARADIRALAHDVAPIIFTACAPCHRPEGGAPLSLLTYDDVRRRAGAIVTAIARCAMPRWKCSLGVGFTGRTLLRIRTECNWLAAGRLGI